MNMRIK